MKIICIEGLDGASKHSVSNRISQIYNESGIGNGCISVSFPRYESPIGNAIHDILHGSCGDTASLPGDLFGSIYTLDRISYFREHIDELEKYDYVILDRSFFSNFIYNCSKLTFLPSVPRYADVIPRRIAKWLYTNYQWEFELTGLTRAESINTVFLHLPDDARNQNIASDSTRDGFDLNESNEDYLDKCFKFTWQMMHDLNMKKEIFDEIDSIAVGDGFWSRDDDKASYRVNEIKKIYFANVNVLYMHYIENPTAEQLSEVIDQRARVIIDKYEMLPKEM